LIAYVPAVVKVNEKVAPVPKLPLLRSCLRQR
jgi:hypothetical protein